MPNIRAFAFRKWHEAEAALKAEENGRLRTSEFDTFGDWILLELLVQSGLRLEEASELTTLDILKRHMPDGRVYYMLHVKPSKYNRARVIPIGDGLGRVIAEMIRHVKSLNGATEVPFCDHWDHHEKRPLPRAPYSVRAPRHPSALGMQGIRRRLRLLSAAAGARKSDGTPLRLHPHDCRRVFATEHLNNKYAGACDSGTSRPRYDRHSDGIRQAVSANHGGGVSKGGAWSLYCLSRRGEPAQPNG